MSAQIATSVTAATNGQTFCFRSRTAFPNSHIAISKYPPAEPGALRCEPLKAAGAGVANAAPIELGHLDGGRSFPEVHLIQPLVFPLLVADVLPNRGLISPYRRYK